MFDSQNTILMHEDSRGGEQGPPSRTRARVKRKLEDSISTKTKQNRDQSPNCEDRSTNSGQPSVASLTSSMPEKRVLELILDVLQRRDTYEIFSEPVDPSEVEEYYEIIKEPMDFGTMRAKLHEGIYRSLEQFEHDVFLIPRNAMHFNSTATIYFRQARAIHELAKKVFHVLKTDPENFELEFSGTRRRSARRPLGQAKRFRLSTDVRRSSLGSNISSKRLPCPLSGPSILRRSSRANPGFPSAVSNVDTSYHNLFFGHREGRKSSFDEADRRCTYRPWKSSLHNENTSVVSTILTDPKSPKLQDISYTKSLMSFVKDLGPTAQMIARRKLEGWREDAPTCQVPSSYCSEQASKYQVPTAFAPVGWQQRTPDIAITTASKKFLDPRPSCQSSHKSIIDIIDLTDSEDGEMANTEDRVGNHGTANRENTTNNEASTISGGMNVPGVSRERKVTWNQSTELQLGPCASSAGNGDLHSSIISVSDASTKSTPLTANLANLPANLHPLILASEHSQSIVSEFKLRNKNGSTSFPWLSRTREGITLSQTNGSMHSMCSHSQATAALGPKNEVHLLSQASQSLESDKLKPLVSQFTFDLPFLKSQLRQMNLMGRDGFSTSEFQKSFNFEGPSFERISYKRGLHCTDQAEPSAKSFVHNPLRSSMDTDLALQL
ncbi:unnamed protein product [Ilex paraguariensis]|uniref:Bromo domain-containing protein n=1 Tax=Ilex paraguariensis TaxID=185542 RepID=A0ABC8SAB7_9AQUA